MAQIFKNNTWGTLASQLTAGATTATLTAGHNFTDPDTDWYLATLIGVTGTTETAWEIVKVTDVSTNTLTIVRAQEGTTAQAWNAGTRIELRLTAGATESKANLGTAAYKAVGTGSGDVAAGDHTHASLYQPLDSDLTALAGLSTTGLIERTGDGTAGIVTITTAGKAILDDADAATQRTTLGLGTDNSPQFTAVNIGHASDTTIARVSAGVVSVEGVTVATASNTLTLTNKTLSNYAETGATLSVANDGDGTYSVTIPLDGKMYKTTLTQNVDLLTSAAPTAPVCGSAVLYLTQAATAKTVSLPSAWKWSDGIAETFAVNSAQYRITLCTDPDGTIHADAELRATA